MGIVELELGESNVHCFFAGTFYHPGHQDDSKKKCAVEEKETWVVHERANVFYPELVLASRLNT